MVWFGPWTSTRVLILSGGVYALQGSSLGISHEDLLPIASPSSTFTPPAASDRRVHLAPADGGTHRFPHPESVEELSQAAD